MVQSSRTTAVRLFLLEPPKVQLRLLTSLSGSQREGSLAMWRRNHDEDSFMASQLHGVHYKSYGLNLSQQWPRESTDDDSLSVAPTDPLARLKEERVTMGGIG